MVASQEQKIFKAEHYAEAIRYMDNAKDILKKSAKDHMHYADPKYVRIACGTAYSGLLIALEAWLTLKGIDIPKRKNNKPKKSIDYYTGQVARLDKKMLACLNTAYADLHLAGYYDGVTGIKTIQDGFDNAYYIIEKIRP